MSRIAAAYFNLIGPPGWQATSAGIDPQAELGSNAPRLLASTPAESFLDRDPPRPLEAIRSPTSVVAICCELPGAERWDLAVREFSDGMREEIRTRTEELARRCSQLEV